MADASNDPSRPARRKNTRITPTQIQTLYTGLQNGLNLKQAALNANVSYSWAKYHLAKQPAGSRAFREKQIESRIGGPIPLDRVCDRAKRALEDFDYFRMVYLGHMPTPWQTEAAYTVVDLLKTPEKEYAVVNEPPGTGKTTLFTHDIAAWVTVRDRSIRGLIGSATSPKATTMLRRLRRTLERVTPVRATPEDKEKGIACDAESTLAKDFGLFKPPAGGDLWRADSFIVCQHGDELIEEKEPTWQAFGMDQDFLSHRVNIAFWDDLITIKHVRTIEAVEQQRHWWDREAESRVEPGGALFLVGQRVASNDLYRHCLDKKVFPDDDDVADAMVTMSDEDRRKAMEEQPSLYKHIVFKAHDEARCVGEHGKTAKAWPEGCLLDPYRLSWRELRSKRANDPSVYATWYQQEDTDPQASLVKPMWVTGGTDPETGVTHGGCWDNDRPLITFPQGIIGPKYSIGTVDPSPTKMWAIQWWIYAPEASHQLFLMDTIRRSMPANEVLDYNPNTREHYGVLEDWQTRSEQLGFPISHWIFEVNAAQRWFVGMESTQAWLRKHMGVQIISHTTTVRKTDPDLGVEMVREWWRSGRIRLPGKGIEARTASLKLVEEVQRYPNAYTDDQVMAHWFVVSHLPNISAGWDIKEAPRFGRPSWVRGGGIR